MLQSGKKAVVWVRVSTEDQYKHGTSPETQSRILQDYSNRRGLEVIKVFTAVETGKYSEDKKYFTELVDFVKDQNNLFDSLLVLKIDRAGRNLKQWVELHEQLRASNRFLIAVEQGIDTSTIQGQLQANIMMSFAEYERQDIIAKTKRGTVEVLRKGYWPKNSPTGFQKDRTSTLKCRPDIPKEPEYSFVKMIFDLYVTGKYSAEEVRQIVEDEGFKVSPQTLSKILHNRFYTGFVVDERNNIEVRGVHYDFRIIEPEDWLIVQEMLNEKNKDKRKTRKGNQDFFLAKTLICSNCRDNMKYGYSTNHRGKKYGYYFCANKECAKRDKVSIKEAHEFFYNYMDSLSVNRDYIERIKNAVLDKLNNKGSELSTGAIITSNIEKRAKLEHALENLEYRYTLGELDRETYQKFKNKLTLDIGSVGSELVELEKKTMTETTILQTTYEEIELIPAMYKMRTYSEKLLFNKWLFPGGLWITDNKILNPKLNPLFRYFRLEPDTSIPFGDLPLTQIEQIEFLEALKVLHKNLRFPQLN